MRSLRKSNRGVPCGIFFCVILAIVAPLLWCVSVRGAGTDDIPEIMRRAEEAIAQGKPAASDFWIARYMGLTVASTDPSWTYERLFPLFNARTDLAPRAILSGAYQESFLSFFVFGMFGFWGGDAATVDDTTHECSVRTTDDGAYFAELVISPYLEGWYLGESHTRVGIIPLISPAPKPFLVSGQLDAAGEPAVYYEYKQIDTGESPLHYVWPLELRDVTGDLIPELWVRYNVTASDGFLQRLDIYAIRQNALLELMQRFEGAGDGFARRLEGTAVEVGTGMASTEETGRLGFDSMRVERWEYLDGRFQKVSETTMPHILRQEEWQTYYFGKE